MAVIQTIINGHPVLVDSENTDIPLFYAHSNELSCVAASAAVVANRRPVHTVSTQADLGLISGDYLVDGQTYQAVGKNAVDDGLGNLYVYQSGSNDTVNDPLILDGPGSVGRFVLVQQESLDRVEESVTVSSPTYNSYGTSLIDASSTIVSGVLGSGLYVGQRKYFRMDDATNLGYVRVLKHEAGDPTVFTFNEVDRYASLEWTGRQWVTVVSSATPIVNPTEPPTGFFVATNGSPVGNGSIDQPWDLATAMGHPPAVQPGDTIWLRGGTYADAAMVTQIVGEVGRRIEVRAYPGEKPILDLYNGVSGADEESMGWTMQGSYTDYRDLEFTNSNPHVRFWLDGTRYAGYTGVGRGAVEQEGDFNRVINCTIHDVATVTDNGSNDGSEWYGNIVYNVGWDTPTTQWDPGITSYGSVISSKIFRENIYFNMFGFGIYHYQGSQSVSDTYWEGNVAFQNSYAPGGTPGGSPGYYLRDNALWGAGPSQTMDNTTLYSNYTYSSAFNNDDSIGYRFGNQNNAAITMTGNYFYSGQTYFTNFSSLTSSNNQTMATDGPGSTAGWTVNASPAGFKIDVRPNAHEAGRGHIIVYNWDDLTEVNVDLSPILSNGATYNIYHVYDLNTAVTGGTYAGGSVTIPLADKTPPTILGDISDLGTPITLPKEFSTFLVKT
jgi:hypothetical protein